jgi:hypothetical protein
LIRRVADEREAIGDAALSSRVSISINNFPVEEREIKRNVADRFIIAEID